MADVFISYAREDQPRIAALVQALQSHGLSVFWDRQIPPGSSWRQTIGEALTQARCVVVAWSQHSIDSQFVADEAEEGRRRRILVPVLLDAVSPPLGFRGVQAADLGGTDAVDDRIAAVVAAVAAVVAASAPGASKAARSRPSPGPSSRPSPGPGVDSSPGLARPPRRIAGPKRLALLIGAIAALVVLGLIALRRPAEAPAKTAAAAAGSDQQPVARAKAHDVVQVLESWRTETGSLGLRARLIHRGVAPMTVRAADAFAVLHGNDAAAQPPLEARPQFETLQSGDAVDFELRFAADAAAAATALRVTLPAQPAYEMPLPALRTR